MSDSNFFEDIMDTLILKCFFEKWRIFILQK